MNKKNKIDKLSDELFRSLRADESGINSATDSPFLFRRIISGINAERKRRAEECNDWRAALIEIKHAIPVLTLAAATIFAALVFYPANHQNGNGNGVEITSISGDEMVNTAIGMNDSSNGQ